MTTLIVVARGANGRPEAKMVGRRERFVEALGNKPFPTTEEEIQSLALRVGAKLKKR